MANKSALVRDYCEKLGRLERPPYKCPIQSCKKAFDRLLGLSVHLQRTKHPIDQLAHANTMLLEIMRKCAETAAEKSSRPIARVNPQLAQKQSPSTSVTNSDGSKMFDSVTLCDGSPKKVKSLPPQLRNAIEDYVKTHPDATKPIAMTPGMKVMELTLNSVPLKSKPECTESRPPSSVDYEHCCTITNKANETQPFPSAYPPSARKILVAKRGRVGKESSKPTTSDRNELFLDSRSMGQAEAVNLTCKNAELCKPKYDKYKSRVDTIGSPIPRIDFKGEQQGKVNSLATEMLKLIIEQKSPTTSDINNYELFSDSPFTKQAEAVNLTCKNAELCKPNYDKYQSPVDSNGSRIRRMDSKGENLKQQREVDNLATKMATLTMEQNSKSLPLDDDECCSNMKDDDILLLKMGNKTIKLDLNEKIQLIDENLFLSENKDQTKDEIDTCKALHARGKALKKQMKKAKENIEKTPPKVVREVANYNVGEAPPLPKKYVKSKPPTLDDLRYEADEDDCKYANRTNIIREREHLPSISLEQMESMMEALERESYFKPVNSWVILDSEMAVCSVCLERNSDVDDAILFCDLCNHLFHQHCYGVQYVPFGPWLCRRCLFSPSEQPSCMLCPNKSGALKQVDNNPKQWVHMVCAKYMPGVDFLNESYLELVINVEKVPSWRYELECDVCRSNARGACIRCYHPNCNIPFHATCAQQARLCRTIETRKQKNNGSGGDDLKENQVKHVIYCPKHLPGNKDHMTEWMNLVREVCAWRIHRPPVYYEPTVDWNSVKKLLIKMKHVEGYQIYIKNLVSYWRMKRLYRKGVPLLPGWPISRHIVKCNQPDGTFIKVEPTGSKIDKAKYNFQTEPSCVTVTTDEAKINPRRQQPRLVLPLRTPWLRSRNRRRQKLAHRQKQIDRSESGVKRQCTLVSFPPVFINMLQKHTETRDASAIWKLVEEFGYISLETMRIDCEKAASTYLSKNAADDDLCMAAKMEMERIQSIFDQAKSVLGPPQFLRRNFGILNRSSLLLH